MGTKNVRSNRTQGVWGFVSNSRHTKKNRRRSNSKRRSILQQLETRQLLAGDIEAGASEFSEEQFDPFDSSGHFSDPGVMSLGA